MNHRAMFVVVVCASVLSGCRIVDNRDGIGRSCTTDGACPLDHFCALDGPVDEAAAAGEGHCAPVLDYGDCDAPSWPVRDGKTLDGDEAVASADDLVRFDGVTAVEGDLRIHHEGLRRVVALGDLCGFSGLQRVAGRLVVSETDATSLDGLQALASVGDGIAIVDNAQLVDVEALESLQFAPPPAGRTFSVLIARNAQLAADAITELKTRLEPVGITVFGCQNKNEGVCAFSVDDLVGN